MQFTFVASRIDNRKLVNLNSPFTASSERTLIPKTDAIAAQHPEHGYNSSAKYDESLHTILYSCKGIFLVRLKSFTIASFKIQTRVSYRLPCAKLTTISVKHAAITNASAGLLAALIFSGASLQKTLLSPIICFLKTANVRII